MLTPEQQQTFQESGFLKISALNADEVEPYRQRAEELLTSESRTFTRYGSGGQRVFQKLPQLAATDPLFARLSRLPSVVNAIETLIGRPEVFRDVLVDKPPRVGARVRYHQDAAYWTVSRPDQVVSAWIPLDEATPESGCLLFVPGSHRTAVQHDIFVGAHRLPRVITTSLRRAVSLTGTGDNPTTPVQRLFSAIKGAILGTATRLFPALNDINELSVDAAAIPIGRQVAVPARPGEVVLFHGLVLHASGPNGVNRPRRAYIVTYVGRDGTE